MYTKDEFTALLAAIILTRAQALDPMREIGTAISLAEMIEASVAARARRNEKLPRPAAEVPTDEVDF